MCYIYVKNVIEANNFAVNWPSTFYNLVIECIRLLLRDLDEEKARGLSGAPKEALLRRRNLYLPEKQSFLEYFAFTLFLERKTVFDLEYLTSETKRYFQQHSSFAEQCHILAELDSTNRSYPNFPLQLIFSGVFTIVDIQNGNAVYDFPHRRFKEVLACEFISTPERYEILLSNISDPAFSELKSVFMSSPRYIDEHLGLSTLQKVLDDARTSNDNAYSCQMSNAFMSFSIIGPPHQQLIRTFLIQCIQTRNPTFCLSVKLLYACKYDDEFRRVILSAFNISISETDVGRLKLSSELLFFFDKPLLSELISQARFDQIRSSGILLILIDSVMILQHGTITPLLQLARTSKELLLNVLYKIAVSQTTHDKDDTEWNIFFRRFFDRLLTEEAVLLFYFIWKYAFDFYALCQKNTNFQVPPEVFNLCDTIVLRGIEMGCDLVRPFFFIGRAFESRLVRLIPDKIQKTVTKKLDNGMRESTVYLIECNKDSLTQMISDRIPGIEYVLFDSFDGLRGEFLRVFFKPFVAKLEEARQDTELVRVGIKEGETVKDVQTLFDQIEDLLTAEALRVTRTTYLTIACAYQEGQSFKEPEIRRYFA